MGQRKRKSLDLLNFLKRIFLGYSHFKAHSWKKLTKGISLIEVVPEKNDDLPKSLKTGTPAKAVPPSAGWIPAPRFREDKLRGNDGFLFPFPTQPLMGERRVAVAKIE